jgi:hypothetical protein
MERRGSGRGWGIGGRVAAILAISALVSSVGAMPSLAAVAGCNSATASRFDGGLTSRQAGLWGARAKITPFDPDLCGRSSVAVAWSMVTARSAEVGGASGWAQVGYGRFGSNSGFAQSGYLTFAQYTRWCYNDGSGCAAGYPVTRFASPPTGTVLYSNAYRAATTYIHMVAGGTLIARTDFTPIGLWEDAWQGQFFGETKHVESDVPGTRNSKVSFSDLKRETDPSGTWAAITSVSMLSSHCRYRYAVPGTTTDFDIWTYPLDSTSC